jgi:preprotein translocase subunit SecB
MYSEMEEALLNLLKMSGFPNIKFEKKIDFEELYNKKFN